ncbi:MAG: type VI secretion system contractile sheath small subunit [Comamonadaceae bacterium]|nr:type VI secretion system contractile sheath small subunit [Comamonadaceae bacterium]
MQFEFRFGRPRHPASRPDGEEPFRILVLGDLTARDPAQRSAPLDQRRPLRVDVDNLDQVFARLSPRLDLTLAEAPLAIELRNLDDFHPDSAVPPPGAVCRPAQAARRTRGSGPVSARGGGLGGIAPCRTGPDAIASRRGRRRCRTPARTQARCGAGRSPRRRAHGALAAGYRRAPRRGGHGTRTGALHRRSRRRHRRADAAPAASPRIPGHRGDVARHLPPGDATGDRRNAAGVPSRCGPR